MKNFIKSLFSVKNSPTKELAKPKANYKVVDAVEKVPITAVDIQIVFKQGKSRKITIYSKPEVHYLRHGHARVNLVTGEHFSYYVSYQQLQFLTDNELMAVVDHTTPYPIKPTLPVLGKDIAYKDDKGIEHIVYANSIKELIIGEVYESGSVDITYKKSEKIV